MAMEAEGLAQQTEGLHGTERRARTERRGRDRRKPGSRINAAAPSQSLLKVFGAYGVGVMTAVLALTILAAEMLDMEIAGPVFSVEGLLLGVSILLIALGSLEQRLIEIRLELMMLNGGRRQADDRRQGPRRRQDDVPPPDGPA